MTLRAAIGLYLLCQAAVSFVTLFIGILLIETELFTVQQSSDPPWSMTILFGAVGIGSFILFKGLFTRALCGEKRPMFLLAAIANTVICINPLILIHQVGNTTLGAHVLYGFPLAINTLILATVLSKQLYTFIFPPKT